MPARMKFDPFGLLIRLFNDTGCPVNVTVEFVSGLHAQEGRWGLTNFSDDGKAEIHIDGDCPVAGAVDVLAHELAHVIAGFDAGHGKAWEQAYSALHRRYGEQINAENMGR